MNKESPQQVKDNKRLADKIMELLKNQANSPHEYINPHFLSEITTSLHDYYGIEDESVDKWINGMWSA